VGLVIDTCHFFTGGSKPRTIEQIDPRRLLIFHINDAEDRPLDTIEVEALIRRRYVG